MPIYEYECEKCGYQTELIQKFSDPPIAECETCHGRMKKLISNSTFHLKGTGWYVTDYASKSNSSKSAPRSSDSGEGAKETGEKTSKIEAKGSAENTVKSDPPKAND